MRQAPVTISIHFVQGLLGGARSRGLPIDSVLADAGIAPELLEQPGARVTGAQYTSLYASLIERLDDEAVGLLSRPIKRGALSFLARSALNAPNLESAMRRIGRGLHLLQEDFEPRPVHQADLAGME